MSKRGRRPEVTDEEIVAVFRDSSDPVLTAGEVAEHVSIGRRAVHDRLTALVDRGVVDCKDVGPHTVWWLVDASDEPSKTDSFFDAPTFASGRPDTSGNVDEALYGETSE